MVNPWKFTLPKPPTTNSIYAYSARSGKAISYITSQGRAWFDEAGWIVKSQRPRMVMKECEVYIELYTSRFQDVDGIIKPTLDLLQKQRVVENDNLVSSLIVHRIKVAHNKDQKIVVEVREL